MTPLSRGYVRICSSVIAPLVLLALLWPQTDPRTSAHLQAARRHIGVTPAIPLELPDGVHPAPAISKPKAAPKVAPSRARTAVWPAIPTEALWLGKKSVFSGLGAWVDVYDYPVLPLNKTIAMLKAAGVSTLFMETGMSGTKQAVRRSPCRICSV